VLIFKVFFLVVAGFRKLQVERVLVNNAFLLSNGLLVIHWRIRNALWITVDGKWMGSRGSQVLVLAANAEKTVSIRIQGLFSSYKRRFVIGRLTALVVEEPPPFPVISLAPGKLCPVFLSDWCRSTPTVGRKLAIDVPPVEFNIPSFQTENRYDTRLLHYP
jgi:hypothetical protein